jgi:hypothetical protein
VARKKDGNGKERQLTSVKKIPPVKAGQTAGEAVRRWWLAKRIQDVADEATLFEAYHDLGIISIGHLLRRLTDESGNVSDKEKDRIALAVAPRLQTEVRGRLGGTPKDSGPLGDLMGTYRVR